MSARQTNKRGNQPGGRYLSTIEILCVCVILGVALLIWTNRPVPNDDEGLTVEDETEVFDVTPPASKTTPSFRPVATSHVAVTPEMVPIRSLAVPVIEQVALDQYIAGNDAVQSVTVDNAQGTVSVVYENGTSDEMSIAELVEVVPEIAVRPAKGLFRDGVDDLKARAEKTAPVSEEPEVEREAVRSAQLDTFKRLAQAPGASEKDLRKAVDNLIPEEMPIAIDTVDQLPWNEDSRRLMQGVMAEWGKDDPMGALAHASTYESLRKRNDAMSSVLNSFAKSDPQGALDWYLRNLETDSRTKSFNPGAVFSELARENFASALQQVNGISDDRVRTSSLRQIVNSVTGEERYTVLENLVYQAQTVEDQQLFAQEYVISKARYQPYEAAAWVVNLETPEVQATAINSLITSWSADRPDQAAEWVMRLSDAEIRSKQLANISKNWARYDPERAQAWLGSFPPDPDLDGAVQGQVAVLRKDDLYQASEWANRIYDPEARSRAVRSIAKDWVSEDPYTARDYIMQVEMDDKNRAKYLSLAEAAIEVQERFEAQQATSSEP